MVVHHSHMLNLNISGENILHQFSDTAAIKMNEEPIETELLVSDRPVEAGYECDLVEKPSVFQTDCPVCLQILREPYQVTCCGKSFCRSCIEHVKGSKNPCPHCNEQNFTDYSNKGLQQSLYQLKVLCTHQRDGCEWIGDLGELENHLNLEPQSKNTLIGCQYSVIECRYHFAGCKTKLSRKEMKGHLQELAQHHLDLLETKYTVTRRNGEQVKEKIQSCYPVPPFEFTLKKVYQTLHGKDEDFELKRNSPPFYTDFFGYKMRLRVEFGLRSVLSLELQLMKGEFDEMLEWKDNFTPMEVTIEVVSPVDWMPNKCVSIRIPEQGNFVHREPILGFDTYESQRLIEPKDMIVYGSKNDKLVFLISRIRKLPRVAVLDTDGEDN